MKMKLDTIRTMMLGVAVAVSPVALLAQVDAGAMPAIQPNMQPGAPNPGPSGRTAASGTNPNLPADSSSGMGVEAQMMQERMFVKKASEGGLAEVQMGQLATQKASNDGVKQFGQKMVDDHTMLNNAMAPIADTMGVPVPKKMTKEDQAEYDKLNALSGTDFDKEYLANMVMDHRKDLREFRMEETEAVDPQLKDAVLKGETVIGEHMRMAYQLAKSNGVEMPRGKRPSEQ